MSATMPNARVVNLRPGNLFKEFTIEENVGGVSEYGRPKPQYQEKSRTLWGCLAQATDGERERWKQLQHPVTHTIVQAGPPQAKPEDRLILEGRVFLVCAVDDCGALGITTIYYAEERRDQR